MTKTVVLFWNVAMHFRVALNIYPVAFGEKGEGDYALSSQSPPEASLT